MNEDQSYVEGNLVNTCFRLDRKIVGDINSEKVQKVRVSLKPNRRDWKEPVPRCWLPQLAILQALGTIKDAKQKTEALFRLCADKWMYQKPYSRCIAWRSCMAPV